MFRSVRVGGTESASGKTSEWDVQSIRHGLEPLGTIRWFGRWRQYAFLPRPDTLFNPDCMEAISAFIRTEMALHRSQESQKPPETEDR